MSRFTLIGLVALALTTAACGNSTTTSPTTTTPTTTTVTDVFSGTLTKNGAASYAFSVSAAGVVYATLTSIGDSSAVVGVSLGTWTGASCTIVLSNDQAMQGTSVTGSVTGIGTLCARVYDVGKSTTPLDYQITVVHP
jgi:hypothetical protein